MRLGPRFWVFLYVAVVFLGLTLSARAAAPHPDDDQIHVKLAEILTRPEFDPQRKEPWYLRLLAQFFQWLASLSGSSPAMYWLLLISCIALLVLILGHILWTVWRLFYVAAGGSEAARREQRQRLSTGYREDAVRCAERGDYTEAIRFLFLALVYRLDESGRVLFPRSFTNREYLSLFAQQPRARDKLRVFVDTLDDHWYGQSPTERPRYEACLGLYDELAR